jgi:hypothetical protein
MYIIIPIVFTVISFLRKSRKITFGQYMFHLLLSTTNIEY